MKRTVLFYKVLLYRLTSLAMFVSSNLTLPTLLLCVKCPMIFVQVITV